MVVRLRLSLLGCKNRPFYKVMAADSRSPRDGKHLEVLGYYNPLLGQDGGKRMGLNFDRVKYWLSVGGTALRPSSASSLQSRLVTATAYAGNGTERQPTRHTTS